MKVLGIVGSARKGGNTDTLTQEILQTARKKGWETEKVFLSDLTINPCDACNVCHTKGECRYQDDFVALKEQLKESSIWILSTPVYWWGPTARMKTFIDRWYQFDSKREFFSGKRMVVVVTSGGSGESYSRHLIGMMTDIAQYLQIEIIDILLCPGVSKKGEVIHKSNCMSKARAIGMKL